MNKSPMVERIIVQIIAKIKDDPNIISALTGGSHVLNDSGMDSIQLINFMLEIEEALGVEINFDEFDYAYLESIETFANYLSDLSK